METGGPSRASAWLDRAEGSLRAAGARLARPAGQRAAVVGIVVLALLLRLPLVFSANDVPSGHNDAFIYFNQAYADYLEGDFYPDAHRGSGWSLLLFVFLKAYAVEPGDWTQKHQVLEGEAARAARIAYALSAMLTVGIVAATWLLARQLLPPLGALGATFLVAIDPYLMFISTSAMSEPPYTALLVLAFACVLKARDHPAWLAGAGALMALAHVLRINGLVMFVAVLLFAALYLRRARGRVPWRWAAASAAAFLLVASPYLAWRHDRLPHALDYGTNQRFWADDLWDMDDAYWSSYTPEEGGPRETMGDWLARHTLWDGVSRLYRSVQWQVFDLFGFGKWPQTGGVEPEGGAWPGSPPDGSALTPLLGALFLVALFAGALRRPELWFLPVALAVTLATFAWIYPLVRSVRYLAPLIPLFAVVGMVGWAHLARFARRPALASAALLALYVALYVPRLAVQVPWGLGQLAGTPSLLPIVLGFGALWIALALAPDARAPARWRRWAGGDAPGGGAD